MHQQPPYPTFITIMESRGLQDADLRVRCTDARVCALAGGAGVVVLARVPVCTDGEGVVGRGGRSDPVAVSPRFAGDRAPGSVRDDVQVECTVCPCAISSGSDCRHDEEGLYPEWTPAPGFSRACPAGRSPIVVVAEAVGRPREPRRNG